MLRGGWRFAGTLLVALFGAWLEQAAADSEEPEIPVAFNISRGPLVDAIRQFSDQSGVQVTANFGGSDVEERPVAEINESLPARTALSRILEGSGLAARWQSSRTVRIYPVANPRALDDVNEVLVTGSRIGGGLDGPAPVRIYGREAIERSGASTLPGVVKYLTQQPFSFSERAQRSGAQHFQMRGLGVDTTLVLINGRRALPSATSATLNAFDLNTIPLPAVDRIEILSDSASAIYGADAIGGVVNIILRQDIDTPSFYLHYGAAAEGGEERRAAGAIGKIGERFKASLTVDYFDRSMLVGAERDLWASQDYSRYGGTDYRVTTTNPGNVYSLTGQHLPGLPASRAAVPHGSVGVLTPEDFLATAGSVNLGSTIQTWSIFPETQRRSLFGSGEFSLNQSVSLFGEVLAGNSDVFFQSDVPVLMRQMVPRDNPFNPFGEDVAVDYAMVGMKARASVTDSEFKRYVLGSRGGLYGWDWELAFVGSDERVNFERVNELDPSRVSAALASTDPNTALNPFTEGPAGSEALLASLVADSPLLNFASAGQQLSGFLRGALFQMPGGTTEFVIGGEWRREKSKFFDTVSIERQRDVSSGFVEMKLPLLATLSAKVAWREDNYEHGDDSGNPQYGLIWRPARDWLLRAAYGTSFRSPSLPELYSPRSEFLFPIADPRRGNSVSVVRFISGGNPDLENISARSFTGGFVYRPGTSPGFHLGAHYWHVEMDNRIVVPRLSDLSTIEETVPGRVIRQVPTQADTAAGWPGALAVLDQSLLNYGELETSGIDIDMSYRHQGQRGRMDATLSATWVDKYLTQEISSTSSLDRVGVANLQGTIPRWRLVGSLVWAGSGWGASATATFTPRYQDSGSTGALDRTLPSRTLVDVQGWLGLERFSDLGLFNELKMTVGVQNLFDRKADFANAGLILGYDSSLSELKQRFVYVRMAKGF